MFWKLIFDTLPASVSPSCAKPGICVRVYYPAMASQVAIPMRPAASGLTRLTGWPAEYCDLHKRLQRLFFLAGKFGKQFSTHDKFNQDGWHRRQRSGGGDPGFAAQA